MKILHVITTINRGGAENHLHDLISGQISQYGCEVSCAWLKGDGYWKYHFEQIGVKLFPLGLARYGQITPLWRLRRAIQNFKPDIIHAHLAPAELYTRVALLGNKNLPLIISRHNESPFYNGLGSDIVERWVVQRAERLIAISGAVKRYFSQQWPVVLSNKLDVVHYGINPQHFSCVPPVEVQNLRRQWSVNKGTILFGTVARLVPVKALNILLEAYKKFISENPNIDTRLVIVGSGPLKTDLKICTTKLGLDERVVWAGFRQDIPVVMNALDIFVLTSLTEGFGLVLLEAMSASKPAICSNVSALPEIVLEGKTGLLVPTKNPGALATAMRTLALDTGLCGKFGRAGYIRATTEFSLDKMYYQTMKIYHDVLRENR